MSVLNFIKLKAEKIICMKSRYFHTTRAEEKTEEKKRKMAKRNLMLIFVTGGEVEAVTSIFDY